MSTFFPNVAAFIADLELVRRRLRQSYFKRVQALPIIVVGKRAFGFDLRESQIRTRFTRRYGRLKADLLAR